MGEVGAGGKGCTLDGYALAGVFGVVISSGRHVLYDTI